MGLFIQGTASKKNAHFHQVDDTIRTGYIIIYLLNKSSSIGHEIDPDYKLCMMIWQHHIHCDPDII